MIPIVDTHQHLWNLDIFDLPWTRETGAAGQGYDLIAKTHVMSDYLAAVEGLNVVKAVYMEIDVVPDQRDDEAAYVIDLCELDDNPTVGAVIGGYPGIEGFRDYVTRYKNNQYIKGVRHVLHLPDTPPGTCVADGFVDDCRWLGEQELIFDLCMMPAEIPNGTTVASACPDTRFILDHCGNPDVKEKEHDVWRRNMAEIAERPNVIAKISGLLASAEPGAWTPDDLAPFVNYTIECFGVERCIFASNWPVCRLSGTLRDWVEALKIILADRSEEDQRRIFHDNAVAFYGLS